MRLFIVPILILLTSCGFHLRGSVQLPPELDDMAVRDAGGTTDLLPELKSRLKNEGINLNATAELVLQLRAEQYGKRVLSVDSSGRAQEYGLSYSVRFSLKKRDVAGKESVVWLNEQTITLTRDLRFDSGAVLGTENEQSQLRKEMRRDAVLQILQRLQKAKPVVSESLPSKPVPFKPTPSKPMSPNVDKQ